VVPGGISVETVDCNDPRVKAAARQLEITIVLRAWEEDGPTGQTIYIQDPWDTHEVPAGRGDTLPKAAEGKASATAVEEPLSEDPGSDVRAGLDDFTAITGVGRTNAQRLHDHGLFTYDDLRDWLESGDPIKGISEHTAGQIEAWLDSSDV
jgi:predicted flap endonuclease-1-like 5' DNA nuclease